jgi:hypothetical protein
MLLRIAAIRPKIVMSAEARGGVGGSSGARVAGISKVSAMLTSASRFQSAASGAAHLYQIEDS